jgi:hypothetical protein
VRRLELLHELLRGSDLLSVVQSHDDGEALYESIKAAGLEGIVSKRRNSQYVLDHRSRDWLKLKNYQFEEVTITGIRKNEFGWSLQYKDGRYAGVCEFVPPEARTIFRQISKQLVQSENQNWLYLDPSAVLLRLLRKCEYPSSSCNQVLQNLFVIQHKTYCLLTIELFTTYSPDDKEFNRILSKYREYNIDFVELEALDQFGNVVDYRELDEIGVIFTISLKKKSCDSC